MWNREQAFWVIEKLEPELAKVGCHCALSGSVAYMGRSEKDLDLIIYPHTKTGEFWDTSKAKEVLREFFGALEIRNCGGTSQIRDDKEVSWLVTPKSKRVDFFFLK